MRWLLMAVLVVTCACASTLSTLQTARPLAPGQVEVSGGLGFFVATGPLDTLADRGIDLGRATLDAVNAGRAVSLSAEDAQALLTAGAALAVGAPGPVTEVALRVGLVQGLDLGLRYGGHALRLDAKYLLAHGGDGPEVPELQRRTTDLALGLGVARHFFSGFVFDALEVVQVDDFERWDLEVPLYASAELGSILQLYAAPKYVFSRTSLDERLVDLAGQGGSATGLDARLPTRVDSHFAGATLGAGLGYRYVHVYAELTGGYTFCRPELFGRSSNLGGVTLYPAVGLALRTPARERPARALSAPPAGALRFSHLSSVW